jgi:signal transduction histidine kinase
MSTDPFAKSLTHGGEMGALIHELDWEKTPFGPPRDWPQSLRTASSICLSSRFPTVLFWGPRFAMFYNEGYSHLLGMKHPSALGRPLLEVWPEVQNVLEPMLKGVASTGVATWSEDQLLPLLRNGYLEEAYFTFSFAPMAVESGGTGGIFCTVTETTERVLSERRLRTLRELGEATLGARSVQDACSAATRALGRNTVDVTFTALYLLDEARAQARLASASGTSAHPAASPALIALGDEDAVWPLAKVMHGGVAQLVSELAGRVGALPGGAWPEPTSSALVLPIARAEQERPYGFLVVGLSPRRTLDEHYQTFLQLAASQLAAAVASARAYEEERGRAESLAELDRVKTAFFSNVSHEFRTPLTLMLGPLQDALAAPERALRGVDLETVVRNGERLLRLVNSLLDFSRLEAGRSEANYEPTDLATLTVDLASGFRSATDRARLSLDVDCPRLSEPVYVDREMWEKIVLNLVSNAFKFTFEGGITVRLCERAGHAVLEVEDTGTGIPAHELPHLFERFHRVRGVRSRSFEGTGIGLALVRELVKLHGGTVEVESEVGRGTRFRVSLPLGTAHLPKDRLQAARGLASTATGASSYLQEALRWLPEDTPAPPSPEPTGRVLVADDNADLRDYLRRVLAPHFQVETAVDGLAALEAARQRPPDLIVSDVMMPRLDGLGLVQRLREDPGTRAIPILLLSARAGQEATVGGLEAGADDYLAKPFSARELIARVRSHLELARMRREVLRHEVLEASLREAVQARDDFLSVASHELKTPLTSFRLQLDLIARDLGEQGRASVGNRLEAARHSVQRLTSLIETLLDVAQLNSGRLRLRLDEVDLRALVDEALGAVREEAARSGSTLAFEHADAVVARCDALRIGQVVGNLLSNAVKFGEGRPVEVSLRSEDSLALLTVTDHGIGITPGDRARIFERFERAVSVRHYSGFGLGLWIARQVVEAHAGHITVTQTPGGGSTFTVELPLQAPQVDAEEGTP